MRRGPVVLLQEISPASTRACCGCGLEDADLDGFRHCSCGNGQHENQNQCENLFHCGMPPLHHGGIIQKNLHNCKPHFAIFCHAKLRFPRKSPRCAASFAPKHAFQLSRIFIFGANSPLYGDSFHFFCIICTRIFTHLSVYRGLLIFPADSSQFRPYIKYRCLRYSDSRRICLA